MPQNNGGRRKSKTPKHNDVEEQMIENLSELEDFQDFVKQVPKKLRDALLSGKKAEDLYKEFSNVAAARAILIAMTEKDSSKALAAIKDLQDRAHGKATERKEISHHLDKLSDEELEAIYKSEIDELGEMSNASDAEGKTH